MTDQLSFKLNLIFLVSTAETRTQLTGTMETLGRREPIACTSGVLEFIPDFLPDEQDLLRRLEVLLQSSEPAALIVVSDRLAVGDGKDRYQPSGLTKSIRDSFRHTPHLCGLVALVEGVEHRTLDIDRTVAMGNLDYEELRNAITKTAMGLWMKSPPGFQPLAGIETGVVQVRLVQSEEELRKCMALRYQIYDLMGYLAEDIANCKAGLEIDSFDINAVHFIAVIAKTVEIVGTTRLVLQEAPRFVRESIIGAPAQTLALHRGWCQNIANDTGNSAFLKRIQHPYFVSLPILQSADFRQRWAKELQDCARGGEISRVVVNPAYRGLGVSRLLMRAAIATAVDLQKSFLLLECVPTHAKMYAHYGFHLLEGHHCRAQELDQVAVGMRLDLQVEPPNEAVALARRDLSMVAGEKPQPAQLSQSGFLCLCQITTCWREGYYESRGKENCPLRTLFQEVDV